MLLEAARSNRNLDINPLAFVDDLVTVTSHEKIADTIQQVRFCSKVFGLKFGIAEDKTAVMFLS